MVAPLCAGNETNNNPLSMGSASLILFTNIRCLQTHTPARARRNYTPLLFITIMLRYTTCQRSAYTNNKLMNMTDIVVTGCSYVPTERNKIRTHHYTNYIYSACSWQQEYRIPLHTVYSIHLFCYKFHSFSTITEVTNNKPNENIMYM